MEESGEVSELLAGYFMTGLHLHNLLNACLTVMSVTRRSGNPGERRRGSLAVKCDLMGWVPVCLDVVNPLHGSVNV